MSKIRLSALLAALTFSGGALYSGSSSAQVLASPKVSSTLAPLFMKTQEQDDQQAKHGQDLVAFLGQLLISGGRKPDDTPYSAYVLLAKAQRSKGSSAEEREALLGAAKSGFSAPDQLASFIKKLEAAEATPKTP